MFMLDGTTNWPFRFADGLTEAQVNLMGESLVSCFPFSLSDGRAHPLLSTSLREG